MDKEFKDRLDSHYGGVRTLVQAIENNIRLEVKSNRELIKNNYKNQKEAIERLDRTVGTLKDSWQADHDRIIKVEEAMAQQKISLIEFKEKETSFGRATSKRIDTIEEDIKCNQTEHQAILEKVADNKISMGKLIGIAGGVGVGMGLIFTIALWALKVI